MPQPTLNDADVDADMAKDWAAIREAHANDEAEGTKAGGAAEGDGGEGGEGEQQRAGGEGEQRAGGEQAEKGANKDGAPGADQPRDKGGRFKERRYKEPKPAAAAARTQEGEGNQAQQQQQQQQQGDGQQQQQQDANAQQQRDLTRPPSSWRPTARAAWANLPEPVRAEIHRREADFMAGQSQLLPDARFGAEIAKTVEPYKLMIESEGGTPATAVNELLRTAYMLRTGTPQQKYGTLANIAQRYGLDLRVFAPRLPQQQQGAPNGQIGFVPQQQLLQPQQPFHDPRVDQLLASMQQQEQQRAVTEQRNTEGLATRWMNETDAQGQPKRPYVNDVIDAMSALIPSLQAENPTLSHAQVLDLAYEHAIWGHPEIRVLLQQQQQSATDTQRRTESQQRAASARRGASVNVPRRGSLPAKPPTGSMEETIAETARELGLIPT